MSIRADPTAFLDLIHRQSYETLCRVESQFRSFVRHHKALCKYSKGARRPQRNRLLKQLAAGIRVPDILNAGVVANLCGILVEDGADPEIAMGEVLRRLTAQLTEVQGLAQRLSPAEREEVELICEKLWERRRIRSRDKALYSVWVRLGKPTWSRGLVSAEFRAWMAMRDMVCPAMTMLCRSMAARQLARENAALVDQAQALAGINRYAYYLAEVLGDVDAELVILHPGQQRGFRVIAEGVRINFQLFDFLQAELIGNPDDGKLAPDWPQPEQDDSDPVEGADLPPGFNVAAWTYYQWTVLRPDGGFAPFREIWHRVLGEQTPLDVLPFAGGRVIILGPCEIPMSWEGFPLPDLHPDYVRRVRVVERLVPAAVRAWLRRIRRAPRAE
jgi:hypothetical protein